MLGFPLILHIGKIEHYTITIKQIDYIVCTQLENMEYHDNNEICINILKTISLGDVPEILCHVGLSPWRLNKCLTLLQKNSLIEYEKNTHVYKVSQIGIKYLDDYNRILDLLSFSTRKREEIVA